MDTFITLISDKQIIIPKIQRDYAQGRESAERIRNNFLEKIETYITADKVKLLHLDFIYGYSDADRFIPIDGQQRLTTLFLLFWYAVELNKKNANESKIHFKLNLSAFTYETRLSSERFCEKLVKSNLEFDKKDKLSNVLKNQNWFLRTWENDPTVKAMLNMLDAIHLRFNKIDNLLYVLINKPITFKKIDIKSEKFKLTDELYIKMNSRGRPLTDFENFKAEFSEILNDEKSDFYKEKLLYKYNEKEKELSYQEYFSIKIDGQWTDLFWNYPNREGYLIDKYLYNYFNKFSEILFHIDKYEYSSKNNKIEDVKDLDEDNENLESEAYEFSIDILKKIYSKKKNVKLLFDSLDFHSSLDSTKNYYESIFTINPSENKIRIFEGEEIDLFSKIIENNTTVLEQIIFYSICILKSKYKESGTDNDINFIRIIRNIFINVRQIDSRNKIKITSDLRINRMYYYNKFIYNFVENFHNTKSISEAFNFDFDTKFISRYIEIEKQKILNFNFTENSDKLLGLENHIYIQGNLESLSINENNADLYYVLINKIWDEDIISKDYNILIAQGLLCCGDYSVVTHWNSTLGDIRFFGVYGSWQRILAPIDDKEKSKTKEILKILLERFKEKDVGISSEKFLIKIKGDYLQNNKDLNKDWKYHFIKYDEILSSDLNLFTWSKFGFDINAVGSSSQQPLSSFHYNPYLKIISERVNDIDVKFYHGRFSEKSWLSLASKLFIYFEDNGLQFGEIDEFNIDDNIFSPYNINKTENEKLILNLNNFNRIEEGINVIKTILERIKSN